MEKFEKACVEFLPDNMAVDLYVFGSFVEDLIVRNLDSSLVITIEKGWLLMLNV